MITPNSEIATIAGRYFTPTILFAIAACFTAYISRLNFAAHDMFHGMALFREAWQIGYLPREDVFAYVPTVSPSVHHEWGMGAILYLAVVECGLGAAGIVVVKYFLTAVVAAGCFHFARRRGASLPVFTSLVGVVCPFAWVGFATVRAQLFTLVFLVCVCGLLEVDRRGRRWWIAIWLPMIVVWLNVHGGFVAGIGLFAVYTIERFIREWTDNRSIVCAGRAVAHLILTGLATVPLLAVNPYGWEYIEYMWHALRMDRSLISEWAPLWQTYQPLLTMLFYVISILLLIYAISSRGLRQLPQIALVAITAWLALRHIRHGSIYAVVWLCYVPAYLEETQLGAWIREFWQRRRNFVSSMAVACLILSVIVAFQNRFWELQIPTMARQSPSVYPIGACDYLAENEFKGNLMVPFSAGSFISWKLYPDVKVSCDGRYEAAYPPEMVKEHFKFYEADTGWQEMLTRYATDAVLIPAESRVNAAMESLVEDDKEFSSNWRRIYADDGYCLYVGSSVTQPLPTIDRTGTPLPVEFP